MPPTVTCACGAALDLSLQGPPGSPCSCLRCGEPANLAKLTAANQPEAIEAELVPPGLRDRIDAALNADEQLVWLGRPVISLVVFRQLVGMIIRVVVVTAIAYVVLNYVRGRLANELPLNPYPYVSVWILIAIAVTALVWWAVGPFYKAWEATRTGYALTSQRALILRIGRTGPEFKAYGPAQLARMKCRRSWLGGGKGDLIFRTDTVVSESYSGETIGSTTITHHGFLAIRNVQQVDRLVRETLLDNREK